MVSLLLPSPCPRPPLRPRGGAAPPSAPCRAPLPRLAPTVAPSGRVPPQRAAPWAPRAAIQDPGAEAERPGVAPFEEVVGPQAWVALDHAGGEDWVLQLSETEVEELRAAAADVDASGTPLAQTTKEDWPLPTLGPKLSAVLDEVVGGRGFHLLKGIPVGDMSRAEAVAVYWGLGAHLGRAVSQNAKGHLVGHVRDIGQDPNNPLHRVYATSAAQPYHTDSADIVALLCLGTAKEGGMSSFSSSVAIHNAMLRARPDLVRVLAEPFLVDRKGEVPAGKQPYYEMPVFHYYGGHLTAVYARGFIEAAQRFDEVPRLTLAQIEALDMMDELAASDELRLDMWLEPGDVQILHNHQIVHARSAFVDYAEEDRKRHLLRLWVTPGRGARPLPPAFAERYGSVDPATRGGIRCPGVDLTVPLEPC